ncbi:MAG: threonine synthase [Bacteroidetes bacterium]|nr:MAG: threonine synthase [Bacteroidota bacterium]
MSSTSQTPSTETGVSTPKSSEPATFLEAVRRGIAPDGGLYMPVEIPKPGTEFWSSIAKQDFPEMAARVLNLYLSDDLPFSTIQRIAEDAFSFPVPLKALDDTTYLLELFHGPTLAFKDFGARFMARVYSEMANETDQELTILVATSGDTGGAVASGFYCTPGVKVILLYPSGGVSPLQEKQMTTLGENITALEVDGVFDDCQRLVKMALTDLDIQQSKALSSANSINIARLLPQMLYYIHANAQIPGPVTFCVPSGNFGNLTAGLLAKEMGMPKTEWVAATNSNHVVPDYLNGAEYKGRATIPTISNAMDVGNPSNFERLQALYGWSDAKLRSTLKGGWADDEQTRDTIQQVYEKYGEQICPHTATGIFVSEQLRDRNHPNERTWVIPATAHPVKFSDIVEEATRQNVELPERVKECLQKEKNTIKISTDEMEFKEWLLSH